MKTSLFISILALSGSVALAADPDTTPPPKPGANPPVTVTSKATITIDVNGKKETREVDLGNAMQIKAGEGAGATVKCEPAKPKPTVTMRTWLGIATDEPSDDVRAQLPIPDGTGLLIRGVVADSPAAKAGLEKNDILTRLDDQILTNPDQLRKLVTMKMDGEAVRLTYLRKGHEASAEATLGTHAEEDVTGRIDKLIMDKLGTWIGSGSSAATALDPVVTSRFTFQNLSGTGKDGSTANEQWQLFTTHGKADVTEAIKRLEKALRDAGANEQVIAQTRKAVADAVAQLQKAVDDAGGAKGEIQREVLRATEEARKAAEQARREAEEAVRKAVPPAPEPKAP